MIFVAASNVSMAHQWPNSDMKASTSSVNASGSHFVREASGITQARMERPQFKSDMHTGTSQGPGVSTLLTSFCTHFIYSIDIQTGRRNSSNFVLAGEFFWLICYGFVLYFRS